MATRKWKAWPSRLISAAAVHNLMRGILGSLRGRQIVLLEYPVHPRARYGFGKPPHAPLHDVIANNRVQYLQLLGEFATFAENLARIPMMRSNVSEPYWENEWFSGLDAVALYALVALNRPHMYLEVGSGLSTKFAKRAAADFSIPMRMVSIDPEPRSDVDLLCDKVIRTPLEESDIRIFRTLSRGDVLFVDSSHRSFENSDVTVFFLDVLPELKPGVLVHLHDIFLPYDYPPEKWGDQFYSEQYLLASHLLGGSHGVKVVFPSFFVSQDKELSSALNQVWVGLESRGVDVRRDAFSFWFVKQA